MAARYPTPSAGIRLVGGDVTRPTRRRQCPRVMLAEPQRSHAVSTCDCMCSFGRRLSSSSRRRMASRTGIIPLMATEANVAGLHVRMAITNCDPFEVRAFSRAGQPHLEHLGHGPAEPLRTDDAGFVHEPEGPGLGVDVDWELIGSASLGEVA
jgi:hypothetical protein